MALLLDRGADINKATKEGRTPFYYACRDGNIDVAPQPRLPNSIFPLVVRYYWGGGP